MKTHNCLFALVIFYFATVSANNSETQLLQHLMNVNAEWSQQPELQSIISRSKIVNAATFNEWIATHLMLVEQTLRARDISHLSSSQAQNRFQLLDKLNSYWQAKIFPVNDYLAYKNPVFIDRSGTHCAVGYLMQQSGAEMLAREIDSRQKFAFVHEINVAGVKEWAAQNGFTLDELAWIQPGYPPSIDAEDMKDGLDGTVNVVVVDESQQVVYAAGSFSKAVTGANCNNIAAWINGTGGYDWVPLSGGVNGTVHALLLHNNNLYVGGEFTQANGMAANRIAVYAQGQWQPMGSLDSTVRTLAVYNNEIYAGGDFTGLVSKWNGNTWQTINNGLIGNGGVRTLEVWNNQLVIGGNFDLTTGALRKHVAAYSNSQMTTLGFGTLTPVNDFEIHENKLYAACDFVEGSDTCALAVFDTDNFEWTVDVAPNNTGSMLGHLFGSSFRNILSTASGLLIAGDFYAGSGMTNGRNLAGYSKVTFPNDTNIYQLMSAMLFTDKPVNCVARSASNIYFGGEFVTNMASLGFSDTLNHVGYLTLLPVGIPHEKVKQTTLKVFPNPATDVVNIISASVEDEIIRYEIFDAKGELVKQENVNAPSKNISLQNFPPGIYSVRVSFSSKNEMVSVVKK